MTAKIAHGGVALGVLLAGACVVPALAGNPQQTLADNQRPTVQWNPQAAANYMDQRQLWWQSWDHAKRDNGTLCVSCHTQVPYALVRPMLRDAMHEQEPSRAEKVMLDNVEKRVRAWSQIQPFYNDQANGTGKSIESRNAESVLNAIILLSYDSRHLSEASRIALDNAWALQSKTGADTGSWAWLNFNNAPWESQESQYYWAAMMAVAVGGAPDDYRNKPSIIGNISALRMYLRANFDAQPLLNKVALLWASSRIPSLLSSPQRQKLFHELYLAQNEDGGWSLTKLGSWKRRDGTPLETRSDGVATGIVIVALEEGHFDSSYLRRGVAWLEANQNPQTGAWPAWSLNKNRDPQSDEGKFMSDSATGYAALALELHDAQN